MRLFSKDFLYQKTSLLPNAYQQVEWIQSDRNQYIDTNYIFNNNCEYLMDILFVDYGYYSRIIDMYAWGTYNPKISFEQYANGNAYISYGNTNKNFSKSIILNKRFTVRFNNTSATYDGDTITYEQLTISNTKKFWLFRTNGLGTPNNTAKERLYNFKLWDNNVLVRDMIPCYRKTDSVIGMYDIVNKIFYTNAGTGVFTKGGDI